MSATTSASDPVLPDVQMNLVSVKEPVEGIVISNDLCMRGKSASFVRHTVIDVSGTPLAGNFIAGQSFGVIPSGTDENGKPHKVRLYSVACASWGEDGEGNIVSTTPKRLIEEFKPQRKDDDAARHDLFVGVCSNYLCDLQPGATVKVTGPNGKRFVLPVDREAHDYLFIATGTGIAPFRGFVQELFENPTGPTKSRVELIMGSPYATDLLYDDLFTRLDTEHDNFTYRTAISRESRHDGRRGRYTHHVIEDDIEHYKSLLASPRTLIYMCGLIGMQFGVYQIMAEQNLLDGYVTLKDDIADIKFAEWTQDQMKRSIRPTNRCMLEVY